MAGQPCWPSIGGRGGAGASTLVAALALAGVRRSLRTAALDADPLGGGLDLVLGAEDVPGLRWSDLVGARGRVGSAGLLASLPVAEGVSLVSGDRALLGEVPADSMTAVLEATARGCELVVVDLPRHLDAAALAAVRGADRTLVVVPAEVRATAAAARVVSALRGSAAEIGLVVRGPAPGDLDARLVADSLGVELAGECRAEPGLAAALDRGEPPGRRRGPLSRLADDLIASSLAADVSARPGRRRGRSTPHGAVA